MTRLPNFFLVGAPKAATTSLYYYLDQHPQIYMSAVKEPHYFASEIREEYCEASIRQEVAREGLELRKFLAGPMEEKRFGGIVTEWQDYLKLFSGAADQVALGDASPCYLWSPSAPSRIAERIPNARILIMLRDPVDRAFSQYLHGTGSGAIGWSLQEHIRRNREHSSGRFALHYPFLEFGLYSAQVERYQRQFGSGVWLGFYEDFRDDPVEVYQDICRFLGVVDSFIPVTERIHMRTRAPRSKLVACLKRSGLWKRAASISPAALRPFIRRSLTRPEGSARLDSADRAWLTDYYREDIRKLAALLRRNPAMAPAAYRGSRGCPAWIAL